MHWILFPWWIWPGVGMQARLLCTPFVQTSSSGSSNKLCSVEEIKRAVNILLQSCSGREKIAPDLINSVWHTLAKVHMQSLAEVFLLTRCFFLTQSGSLTFHQIIYVTDNWSPYVWSPLWMRFGLGGLTGWVDWVGWLFKRIAWVDIILTIH